MSRFGRLVEHDPRSREHAYTIAVQTLRTVTHRSYGLPFNQGNLGSCTGNACAGALNTVPLHRAKDRVLTERDAISLYKLATRLDTFPGEYPPDDTGSSGLAIAKAAKQDGFITRYRHAFGVDQALAALQVKPVITGTNWTEQMDTPTAEGFARVGGEVLGGHEYLVKGYVAARRPYVVCCNSWGENWGPLQGRFRLFVDEWAQLLEADGDVTILDR